LTGNWFRDGRLRNIRIWRIEGSNKILTSKYDWIYNVGGQTVRRPTLFLFAEENMKKKTVGMELRSLNNLIKRYIENSQHFQYAKKITGTNGWIIAYLFENEGRDVFQRDLEERFTITRSTISKVLKLMEQKGLIQRLSVEEDARLKKIILTDKAREIHQAVKEDLMSIEKCLMKDFSPEEKDQLFTFIDRMKANMEGSFENLEDLKSSNQ
jgi:DNA-binding MarR family transcriptional regulator